MADDAGITLREWTEADIESVRHIALTTWLDAYASLVPADDLRRYLDEAYSPLRLSELCRDPEAWTLLALDRGAVVGFIRTAIDRPRGRFNVASLYVLPASQGRGVGGRLLDRAEARAAEAGFRAVWLGVMSGNTPALGWYRRRGYVFDSPEEPFTIGRTTVLHLIGSRQLGANRKVPGGPNDLEG